MKKIGLFALGFLATASFLSAEGALTLSAGGTAAEGDTLPVAFVQGAGTVSFRRGFGTSSFVGMSAEGSLRTAGYGGDTAAGGRLSSRVSRTAGPLVAALEAALEAATGDSEAGDYSLLSLGTPVNINLEAVSFMVSPGATLFFGPDEGAMLSLEGEANFGLGDFVLKPSLGGSYGWYYDGFEEVSIYPSLGISWYPLFPASASISGKLQRRINAEDGSESLSAAAEGSLALSPARFLLVSLHLAGVIEENEVSYSGILGTEFFPPAKAGDTGNVNNPVNLSFPLELRVTYDPTLKLMAEGSFGIRLELP